jgi:ligand-binding sensor domain-containing protein/signal transduction histidine kinase
MAQYRADQWGAEQGFPGGAAYAITQTADGYLWIGTENGLVRFDGLNFRLINVGTSSSDPIGPVLGLAADAEGNLWLRLERPRLLRYRDGTFQEALPDHSRPEDGITAMCRGNHGQVLFSGHVNDVLRYSHGTFAPLVPKTETSRALVISIAETPDGKVWMGTRETGLVSLSEGRISSVVEGLPDRKINCLLPFSDREVWIGTDNGIVRWTGSNLASSGVPAALNHTQVLAMLKDRESNVWVGTSRGLYRINSRGLLSPEKRDNLPTGPVTALYEDREGNLLVGGAQGIERFRDNAFLTYSLSGGLPSSRPGALYADAEGRTWFAPEEGGLYWLKDAQIERVTNAGLSKDVVYSIAGGDGEIWVGRQQNGLTRLRRKGSLFTGGAYTHINGLAQNSVYAVHRSRDGTVWAGTLSGGVSRFANGRFTTYTTVNGLASNTVSTIEEGTDGTMFFGTPNGLSALSHGSWRVYTVSDGLPPGGVNCLLADSKAVLWIGTTKGLAFLKSGSVQVPRAMPESLYEETFGIAEDRTGYLWIAASNHVVRVKPEALLQGVMAEADVRDYGPADGLLGTELVKRHRSVIRDPLGRIWFSMNHGISVVDPARLARDAVSVPIHIEAVSADGRQVDLRSSIRIPAVRQRVTFSYAGVSLSAPERVKFRYMLDGFDHRWSEPVSAHDAVYTNLSPGSYRFRVIASNAHGVWNSKQATIGFAIEPALWQRWWFRILCTATFLLGALALFRHRMHRMTAQLNLRFEERLAERTRIAQELHDTLLQGFLSASMQLHVAVERLPAESPATPAFNHVLQLMGQVIDEGRNVIRGLRSSDSSLHLERAFSRIPHELSLQDEIGFHVIVEGRPRPLHPLISDEVYHIGREAAVNAFRHSRAKSVEVELEYARHRLRMLVRDNGCGIDPVVLRSNQNGHRGLSDMRERAERIGCRLSVWSSSSAGTEVELSVPGHVAFLSEAAEH